MADKKKNRTALEAIETEGERAKEHITFMSLNDDETQRMLEHDIGLRAWLVEVETDLTASFDEDVAGIHVYAMRRRAMEKLARIIAFLTIILAMVPA